MLPISAIAETYITLGGWSAHKEKKFKKCEVRKYDKEYTLDGKVMFTLEDKAEFCDMVKFNSNHNAFIVDHKGFTAGYFKNSYNKDTYLLGYTYRINDFSLSASMSKGYEGTQSCIKALGGCLLLSASYTLPYYTKLSIMGDALAVSFEFSL